MCKINLLPYGSGVLDETMRISTPKGFATYDNDLVGFAGAHGNMSPEMERYVDMRMAGESHRMAEMLATRRFPGVKTDSIFNEGRFSGDSGKVGPEQLWLKSQAEAAGVSTNGKYYMRGLADFPGDPTAWVSDRGDVLRIAEAKNMTVHGYVEHRGHEVEPDGDLAIADDIVENEVLDILDSNPHAKRDEVRDQIFALRSGSVDPNPLRVNDSADVLIPGPSL